jgi:hypothetical protein
VRLAVLVLAFMACAACERRSVPVSMETVRGEDAPVQETWNAHFVQSTGGTLRLDVRSAYQASFERGDSSFVLMSGAGDSAATRVVAVVFGEDGDTTAVIRADLLYWYEDQERFEAQGNVVADAKSGRRVESEHLDWDDRTGKLSTPGFARIYEDSNILEGYGLTADEALGEWSLANFTGQVEVVEE